MKDRGVFLASLLILATGFNCASVTRTGKTGIQGGVYSKPNSVPFPTRHVATTLDRIHTISVLDSNRTVLKEFSTNGTGKFEILLPPGIYFLRVKDSPYPAQTGPFEVKEGVISTAEAHYDEGR